MDFHHATDYVPARALSVEDCFPVQHGLCRGSDHVCVDHNEIVDDGGGAARLYGVDHCSASEEYRKDGTR